MGNGSDPIDDDELLYRRIPASTGWYAPASRAINPQAFAPHKIRDISGLSVSRAKYKSAKEAARGEAGKQSYVAVLRAQNVRALGIEIIPLPRPGDPGHAEMPSLNASNRKDDLTLHRQVILVNLCLRVEGPFTFSDDGLSP